MGREEHDWQGDRWTKVPIDAESGRRASSTGSDTWTSYERALEVHNGDSVRTDGLGFVVSDDDMFIGVDLDGCYNADTGEYEPWASEIMGTLDSYTEHSPSNTGVRGWVLATKPGDACRTGMSRTLESLEGSRNADPRNL